MFDEQPDGDPHGECAAEIHRLEALVAQQAAVIEQMRSCFRHIADYWNRDQNEKAMADACWKTIEISEEAFSLQPCPEVLNKVRADAVKEVAESLSVIKGSAWISVVAACAFILREAQRIEQGEA